MSEPCSCLHTEAETIFPLAFLPMLTAAIAGDSSSLPALPVSGHSASVSVGFEVKGEDDKEDEAKDAPQE